MKTKICTKCGIERELNMFYADKSKIDGKHSQCKSCDNEKQAIARKNPKYIIRFNKYQKIYYKTYRKSAKHKAWRKKALEKRKVENKALKLKIINHYGGKCKCCGISEHCFLGIDHINNDGYKMRLRDDGTKRKNKPTGFILYQKIVKENYPTDLQLYCFNCNTAKQHNNGICPHQIKK